MERGKPADKDVTSQLGEKLPKLIFKKSWSVFECEKVSIPKPVLSRVWVGSLSIDEHSSVNKEK